MEIDFSFLQYDILPVNITQRLIFATSVMHAYGHQWACQLVYNPRLRQGLGLTEGEGTERIWSKFRKLIGVTRTSGVRGVTSSLCWHSSRFLTSSVEGSSYMVPRPTCRLGELRLTREPWAMDSHTTQEWSRSSHRQSQTGTPRSRCVDTRIAQTVGAAAKRATLRTEP